MLCMRLRHMKSLGARKGAIIPRDPKIDVTKLLLTLQSKQIKMVLSTRL